MKFFGVHFVGMYKGGLAVFVADSIQEAEKLAQEWLQARGDADARYGYVIDSVTGYVLGVKGFVDEGLYAE